MKEFDVGYDFPQKIDVVESINPNNSTFDIGRTVQEIDHLEQPYVGVEAASLEPEVRFDIPGCPTAFVTGNPFQPSLELDYQQGDNPYSAQGNCGLLSIVNSMRRGGIEITEDMVTKKAIDSGLCEYDVFGDPSHNGGTTAFGRQKIFELLGIDSEIVSPDYGGKIEDIADAIESGKGVVLSGNAGILWNIDDGSVLMDGKLPANHCVAVTGVARDASTGNVAGVYICDSGRGQMSDACRFLSRKEFDNFYTDVYNGCANITKKAIVEV